MNKPMNQPYDDWLRGQFDARQLDDDKSSENVIRQVRKRMLLRRWLIIAALTVGAWLTGTAAFQLLTKTQVTLFSLLNLGIELSAEWAGSLLMAVIIAFGFGYVLMFED